MANDISREHAFEDEHWDRGPRSSSPAGLRTVSMQESGGETPPEPAAGTAALRGGWRPWRCGFRPFRGRRQKQGM